jgi:hypothetical protein
MPDLFEGRWKIDLDSEQSRTWDAAKGDYIKDPIGSEITTFRVEGGVQHYEVLYGKDPTIRMGYVSRYDGSDWAPYTVYGIEGVPEEQQAMAAAEFRERTNSPHPFVIGKPIGMVRTVYVDEHTHYRVSKSSTDGSAEYILLRRMDKGGASYLATLLNVEGKILIVRRFVRES